MLAVATVYIYTLDPLPDAVRPRSQDIAATDVIVLHHLRLGDHLGVPVTQVLLLPGLQA